MKKNKKIVIAIIVFAVLILVVGIALAFVLKNNNKEEFFKYASQIFDSENGFIDNRIEQYNEKKAVEKFENQGKITVNVPTENLDSKTANEINNTFNISFAGNIDNENQMAEELIKINYDKENNFPVLYKKSGDIQGLKLSKIMQKYLSVNLSENSSLFSNFGINTNMISSFEISQEDKDKIKNDYLSIIKDNLDEKSFSKVTTSDSNGYTLEISNEKLQDIIIKLFEQVKNDEQLLDKLNMSSDVVDGLINSINLNEGKTIITIYHKDNKLNRIVIELDDYFKFDVKKVEVGEDLEYDISLSLNKDDNNIMAKVVLGFSGLNSLETVTENHSLGIDFNGESYTYNFENEVNFTDVEIKDFEENEYVDINKMSQENQAKLIQAVISRFTKINNELIEKVGVKSESFWSNLIPQNNAPKKSTNEFEDLEETEEVENEENEEDDESKENSNLNTIGNTISAGQNVNDSAKNVIESDNLSDSFSEAEKQAFNGKYLAYEGENVRGSNVKALLMQVIANNMADEERQIKVSGDVTLTGNEVPDSIETSKTYSVKFTKSKDGYINEVKIKEVE